MDVAGTRPAPFSLAGELKRTWNDAPVYAGAAIVLALAALPMLGALAWDGRTVDGVSGWLKPIKFQLSFALYAATLALYARFVPLAVRDGRAWRAFTWIVVGCLFVEAGWIAFAAAIGERSHFNFDHAWLSAIYPAMGVLAVVLTAATAQFAYAIHRHGVGVAEPLRSGLVWGLALTLPLTIFTAFWLAGGAGHHVEPGAIGDVLANGPAPGTTRNPLAGTGGSDTNGLPLFGWSAANGDLRVPHFFATHAMQIVPLAALALGALGWRSRWAGRVAGLASVAIVAATFAQALAGQPFVAWS